jgi:hypothetical protein
MYAAAPHPVPETRVQRLRVAIIEDEPEFRLRFELPPDEPSA